MFASLKQLYNDDAWVLQDLIYRDNPAFTMMDKEEDVDSITPPGGQGTPVPVIYGSGQGGSADFTTSLNNQSATSVASFLMNAVNSYQLFSVSNSLVESSGSKLQAFADTVKMSFDTCFQNMGNDCGFKMFGDGSGTRGQIFSLTTGVIVLTDPALVTAYEIGMVLQSTATLGGAPRTALGYVIAVNRTSGVVTVSATASGSAGNPTSWAANDYLVRAGDIPSAGVNYNLATTFLCPAGFAAWLPITAPGGSDNFFSVNRSTDSRLYGTSFDGSKESIKDALIDIANNICREGGNPDISFINFNSYAALLKEIDAQVEYIQLHSETAGVSFPGIRLYHQKGSFAVMADRSVASKTGWVLTMANWKLKGINKIPHIAQYKGDGGIGEGLEGLRASDSDSLQVRLVAYYQQTCNAPNRSGQVLLSA